MFPGQRRPAQPLSGAALGMFGNPAGPQWMDGGGGQRARGQAVRALRAVRALDPHADRSRSLWVTLAQRRGQGEGVVCEGEGAGRCRGDAGVPPLRGGGAEHEQGAGTGCQTVADHAGGLSPASRRSGCRGACAGVAAGRKPSVAPWGEGDQTGVSVVCGITALGPVTG